MTNLEFIDKLKKLANRQSKYNNKYPYNCCYYDGEYISADCYCLIKSIFWDETIADNYTSGRYARPKVNIFPDYTIAQMMAICTKVSNDFSNITPGVILQYDTSLGHGGHAGVYIGDGKVVESTTAWNGGIQISEIDNTGTRSKDGKVSGRWMKWGTLPQLEYIEKTANLKEENSSIDNNIKTEEKTVKTSDLIPLNDIETKELQMADIFSKEFWKDTLERVVYTVAETAIAAIGTTAVISEVDWKLVVSTSLLSGVITLLKCIVVKK